MLEIVQRYCGINSKGIYMFTSGINQFGIVFNANVEIWAKNQKIAEFNNRSELELFFVLLSRSKSVKKELPIYISCDEEDIFCSFTDKDRANNDCEESGSDCVKTLLIIGV